MLDFEWVVWNIDFIEYLNSEKIYLFWGALVSLAFSLYLSFCFVSIPCAILFHNTASSLSLSLTSSKIHGLLFFSWSVSFWLSLFVHCTSSCSFLQLILHYLSSLLLQSLDGVKIWVLAAIVIIHISIQDGEVM